MDMDMDTSEPAVENKSKYFNTGKLDFTSTQTHGPRSNQHANGTPISGTLTTGATSSLERAAADLHAAIQQKKQELDTQSQQGAMERTPTLTGVVPCQNQQVPQPGAPASNVQTASIPTSTMLTPFDLLQLRQPPKSTPTGLKIAPNTRSNTRVVFYDTLVAANTKMTRLAKNPNDEKDIAAYYLLKDTVPFWSDWVPLNAEQILVLAQQAENEVVSSVQKGVNSGKAKSLCGAEYAKVAGRLGLGGDAKGVEDFAARAKELRGERDV